MGCLAGFVGWLGGRGGGVRGRLDGDDEGLVCVGVLFVVFCMA